MSEPTILPCPFCGHAAGFEQSAYAGDKWGTLCCPSCAAHGPEVRTGYEKREVWLPDAIEAWNRRASLSSSPAAPPPTAEPVAWQKCPICDGRGVVAYPPNAPLGTSIFSSSASSSWPCEVCHGAKILVIPCDSRPIVADSGFQIPHCEVTAEDLWQLEQAVQDATEQRPEIQVARLYGLYRKLGGSPHE